MKRLIVAVDDIAVMRYLMKDSDIDPVQVAVLAETAGAAGITALLADSERGVQERDAALIKKLSKTFVNLHIPADPRLVKQALNIKPDMVTFVEVGRGEPPLMLPVSASGLEDVLGPYLADFHANGISVGVFAEPEIGVLKALSRVQVDYVEFDARGYTEAADSNDELVGLDRLSSAALGAVKLGLGVNCYGGIDFEHLPSLAQVPRLEDIGMGMSLAKRALLVGVDRAVREARELILFHHRA